MDTLKVNLYVSGTEANDHNMGVFGDDNNHTFEDDVAKGKRRKTVRWTRAPDRSEGVGDSGEDS